MLRGLVPIVGLLLLLSSLAHAFAGWPPIRAGLAAGGVDAPLLGAVSVGWYFGSVAMAMLGTVVLISWRGMLRGGATGRAVAACVALGYLAFGAAAFFARSFNPHFLIGFVLPGALLALGVFGGSWKGD